MPNVLEEVKQKKWFYEFHLPDGTKTESYLPESVRKIHLTRERILRKYLDSCNTDSSMALDISCHEGYFSLVLAEHFETVIGLDKNADSVEKAKQITTLLQRLNIEFVNSPIEAWDESRGADFVLCFGLLYHVENPIQILRKLAALTRKILCIETQVLPFNFTGSLEDGSYIWQRDLNGIFGLCHDYSDSSEGGLTNLCLVPSRQALEFLLKEFGFKTVSFNKPEADDYEQFVRGHRVIVFAEK